MKYEAVPEEYEPSTESVNVGEVNQRPRQQVISTKMCQQVAKSKHQIEMLSYFSFLIQDTENQDKLVKTKQKIN